jgi:hypothetical protein
MRTLVPGLMRKVAGGPAFTTQTSQDAAADELA